MCQGSEVVLVTRALVGTTTAGGTNGGTAGPLSHVVVTGEVTGGKSHGTNELGDTSTDVVVVESKGKPGTQYALGGHSPWAMLFGAAPVMAGSNDVVAGMKSGQKTHSLNIWAPSL